MRDCMIHSGHVIHEKKKTKTNCYHKVKHLAFICQIIGGGGAEMELQVRQNLRG